MLVLAACGGGSADSPDAEGGSESIIDSETGFALYTGEPQQGGVVTVLGGVDFASLDPAMGNDGNVNNFYQLIYRNLTQYRYDVESEEMELVGDLAESWESNDDATVWTFTLKEGIRFEDGSDITAQDVKFGFERAFDPSLAIGSDYLKTYIDGAPDYDGIFEEGEGLDSIVVVDDRTIEFRTAGPMAAFPYVLATPPATPFPADGVDSPGQIQETPIASGPYRVESYAEGDRLTLVRNEEWDAETDPIRPANPDGFEFLFTLDDSTIDQRVIAGQGADASALQSSTNPLQAASLNQVQQNDELSARTVRALPTCTMYMAMDTTTEPLDQLEVRQAIHWAIDKQSVVNSSGGPNLAEVANDMLLPLVPERTEFNLFESPDDAGDAEQARELLAEAGYEDGFELTMDVRNLPTWQAQAESVQQSLAEVGIDVSLNVIDAANYYEQIGTPSQMNDMAITGWCTGGWYSGEPLLTPLFHGDRITETGNPNIAQFDNSEINDLFDQAAVMTDLQEQNQAYAQINELIVEQAPIVPLIRQTNLQMVGEDIGGAFAHPARTGYLSYADLGLKNPESE